MKTQFGIRALSVALTLTIVGSVLSGCGNESKLEKNQHKDTVNESLSDKFNLSSNKDIDEAKKAEEEAKKAEEEAKRAEEEAKKKEEEAKKAEEEARVKEERLKAEAEAKKAEEERIKAEEETKKAEEERLKAEAEAKKAEEERLKAEAEAKKAEEERYKAEEEAANALTPTQLTSINMLHYMTVLTQKINTSNGNQLFLETARTSLYNDTNLNAVDTKTQAQITQLVSIIDQYRMVDVKRERLRFIYERNQAQALRQAIPNPMGLLSAVQSGSLLKAAASVVYMAVDSVTSYQSASSQAELQFIQEGWALDDEETKLLQDSTTAQFNYMCNMVRDYDLPDEYIVRDEDVRIFVEWANKTNRMQKIDWLKANESKYQKFGPYWLELVKDYYNEKEYKDCLEAIAQYESISARITRKDQDYAEVLPMVIIAAKETMSKYYYTETARKYCKTIIENTKDEDWSLRYFVAQIYLDLYRQTKDKVDLKAAYDIVYYNVNTLVDEQKKLNATYLAPIVEAEAEKDATKRAKEEIKQYNKLLKDERKVALPPVSEALYLNCELLFALAKEVGIDAGERGRIDGVLHENGDALFLSTTLDNRFRYGGGINSVNAANIPVTFDGSEFTIPVAYLSDRYQVTVKVNGTDLLDDWVVDEVERPKNTSYTEYTAELYSKKGKAYDFKEGDRIDILVVPVADSPEDSFSFSFEAIETTSYFVMHGIDFVRK